MVLKAKSSYPLVAKSGSCKEWVFLGLIVVTLWCKLLWGGSMVRLFCVLVVLVGWLIVRWFIMM